MANRSQSFSFRAKRLKACGEKVLLKDRLSELPDEIAVTVLSLLTMKEAGQTSLLSKRWRYVWAYIPVLNFDALDTLYKIQLDDKSLEVEKPRYLNWVNQVVESYKGPTIDEFRVQFDLDVDSENLLDNWVEFAMEKSVKRLELDLSPHMGGIQDRCCTFGGLLISNLLTSFRLVFVLITGEVVQKVLKCCPNLVSLSVTHSDTLVNLEVVGETLNLKYLDICSCQEIKHIEVSAPNLVSFKYFGPTISMPLKKTPKLARLSIGSDYGKYLSNNFLELSSYPYQLNALALDLGNRTKDAMKSKFPQCTNVKQLELAVTPGNNDNLFCLAPLIKACPFLEKFVLKIFGSCSHHSRRSRLEKAEAFCHDHLKTVEIVGFIGETIDMKFSMYLIKSCVALEKIVIDTRDTLLEGSPWEFKVSKRRKRARKQAEELRAKLEPGVDLIIL